jgi:small conductance mechanosensitive channel
MDTQHIVNVSETKTLIESLIPKVIAALAVLIIFWLIYRLTHTILTRILSRTSMSRPLIHILVHNIYKYSLLILGIVMAASQLGIDVGAALAGIGVIGIAIGFAAQDSLSNIISGFMIFFDKPFKVGDWISVADRYGKVQNITMRTTRIRTNQNTYVVIPNKSIINEVLHNHTLHGKTRLDIAIGIGYNESIDKAREVLLKGIKPIKTVMNDPAPDVVVKVCGESSVDLLVRVWIDDAADEMPTRYAVTEAAKKSLDKAGIEIPFPQRVVHLKQ